MPSVLLVIGLCCTFANNADAQGMVKIDAGEYRPLYLSEDSPMVNVNSFWLDVTPISNRDFLKFVKLHSKWRKSKVASLFAESRYLTHWRTVSPIDAKTSVINGPSKAQMLSPVNHISWFASQAYCHAQGKRLPSVAEWERAGSASETQEHGGKEKGYNQKILQWYSKPTNASLTSVAQQQANFWGVHDMHGLIWEWTDDFNSNLTTGESRGDSSLDQNLFCGSGAAGAADPSDYAAFMRFAFRTSLKAKFTQANLGFRCASDKEVKR